MLYQTHAIIHLDHIRANLLAIRRAVGPERKLMVPVKANAYGHGAIQVARTAELAGADWLAVATVPEGLQLREAGITLPILKFSPAFAEEMPAAVRAGITFSVCDKGNVETLEATCASLDARAVVQLVVDTGMA